MDRLTGIFADGIGAAAATSGILTHLQGRIFGLLYLQPEPLSLDEITDELQQSKSNVSVQIRGLVDCRGEPMAPEAMRDSVVSRIPIEEGSGPAEVRQPRSKPQVSHPRVRRTDAQKGGS